MRTVIRSVVVLSSIIVLAACTASSEPEQTGEAEQAASGPTVCPMLAIYCGDGYHAESLPHCKQICVKDRPQCNGCGKNSYCAECKSVDGTATYVCLPNGAMC